MLTDLYVFIGALIGWVMLACAVAVLLAALLLLALRIGIRAVRRRLPHAATRPGQPGT
ncbi:hypothetical protein ABTX35_18945 [Streptomyces sp. NPDC096080]|uniref:hypothetical protein n=1 Tax=Streptomyces sp. NPDC096080 TaxID=3156693 RepID=UPI003329C5D4